MKLSFKNHAILNENKVQWLKDHVKEFNTDFDVNAKHREPEQIIDHWASADPHPKKANTQWIINRYRNQDFRQEDHMRVNQALSNFERYKGKLDKKDINQYKSLSDVEDAVEPHLGGHASKKEAKAAAKIEGAEKVYDSDNLKVYHIKTHAAACQYGAGTKWCTAMKDYSGHFDTYTKQGPIYAVIGKHPDGEQFKYQFHFPSNQFMKEDDKPIQGGIGAFVKKHPEVRNVFKGQHPLMDDPHEFNQRIASGHVYPGYRSAIEEDHTAGILTPDSLESARIHWAGQQNSEGSKHLVAIAGHPNTHPDTLNKMKNEGENIRVAIAKNPSATNDLLDHLVKNSMGSHNILNAVAGHPKASSDLLHEIVVAANSAPKIGKVSAVEKVAQNPNLADHTRAEIMKNPDYYTDLLKNPSSKTEHISDIWERTKTSKIPDMTRSNIEEDVAAHPNTHPDTLHELAFGTNHLAASNAIANPNMSVETRQKIHDTGNDAKKAALAKSPHTPDHILQSLSGHSVAFISKMARENLKKRGIK